MLLALGVQDLAQRVGALAQRAPALTLKRVAAPPGRQLVRGRDEQHGAVLPICVDVARLGLVFRCRGHVVDPSFSL